MIFLKSNFSDLDIPTEDIQFDKARLTVGINDLRGIEKQIDLNWDGKKESFNYLEYTNLLSDISKELKE